MRRLILTGLATSALATLLGGCVGRDADLGDGSSKSSGSPATASGASNNLTSGKDKPNANGPTAVPAVRGLSAEVSTSQTHKDVSLCSLDLTSLSVKLPNAEAQTKINSALKFDIYESINEDWDCTSQGLTSDVRFLVRFNGGGILSVLFTQDFSADFGNPSQDVKSLTFDLATGPILDLSDLVDATGRAAIATACKSAPIKAPAGTYDAECESAVEDAQYRGHPVFEIEDGGIRIHPVDVANVGWYDIAGPGALAPWSVLKGHIINDLVSALAL